MDWAVDVEVGRVLPIAVTLLVSTFGAKGTETGQGINYTGFHVDHKSLGTRLVTGPQEPRNEASGTTRA